MQLYETHKMPRPEIPFIFCDTFRCSRTHLCCICNWHENIEILMVLGGKGFVRVNEDRYPVEEGDIAVVNSGQMHDIFSRDSMHYACLIIDRSFFLQNYLDSNKLTFSPVIKDPELFQMLLSFKENYKKEDSPYQVQLLRRDAMDIIVKLCQDHCGGEVFQKGETRIHATIKKVIYRICSESQNELSLDSIAKDEGWNKSYLAREFRRYTGQTMIEFLNTIRCENARKMLLESDLSVGEVGRRCGFNDQTYFTRVFRKHLGKTPGGYRKEERARRGL